MRSQNKENQKNNQKSLKKVSELSYEDFFAKIDQEPLVPYKNEQEYLDDLDTVLRKDYGVQYGEEDLKEAGRNIEIFLINCL